MTAAVGPLAEIGVGDVLAQVARMRREGRTVIPLHSGEPDFPTPTHVVDAGIAALRAGQTHYTPPGGMTELRDAVVDEMRRTRGLDVRAEQVIVTPGAKMATHVAMQAFCRPGDEVVCIDPSYGAYAAQARFARATVRTASVDAARRFRLDLERLEHSLTPRTRLLVVNSPCNPTGHVLDRDELDGLAGVLEAYPRILLVSDEIYSRIVYDVPFTSPASDGRLRDRTIVVDGVSKTHAMTGWRVGYAVLPEDLVADASRIALDTFFCVNGAAQLAAAEALRGPQDAVAAMVATYRRRRDRMIDGVNAIPPLSAACPDGAFYAWVDARALGMTSAELSLRLLSSGGVATYPGSAFGAAGEGFVRLTFATSEENIASGLERIAGSIGEVELRRDR